LFRFKFGVEVTEKGDDGNKNYKKSRISGDHLHRFLNIEPRGDETENNSIVQGRHLKIEPTDMGMKPR
jgi:hypothetical protein